MNYTDEWKDDPLGKFPSWEDKKRCLELIYKAYEAAPKENFKAINLSYSSDAFKEPREALEALGIRPIVWFYGWEHYGNLLALTGEIPEMSKGVAAMFDGIYGEGNW